MCALPASWGRRQQALQPGRGGLKRMDPLTVLQPRSPEPRGIRAEGGPGSPLHPPHRAPSLWSPWVCSFFPPCDCVPRPCQWKNCSANTRLIFPSREAAAFSPVTAGDYDVEQHRLGAGSSLPGAAEREETLEGLCVSRVHPGGLSVTTGGLQDEGPCCHCSSSIHTES